jgi:hypothetical protein
MPKVTQDEVQYVLGDPDVFGDEENLWGMEKSMDWRLAWQRAVARAWIDPSGYGAELKKDSKAALRKVGYEVPDGLKIKIEDPLEPLAWDPTVRNFTWTKEVETGKGGKKSVTKKEIAANGWACSPKPPFDRRAQVLRALETTVILRLPPRPTDQGLAALALADYDGLSRAYPFTCCAIC